MVVSGSKAPDGCCLAALAEVLDSAVLITVLRFVADCLKEHCVAYREEWSAKRNGMRSSCSGQLRHVKPML